MLSLFSNVFIQLYFAVEEFDFNWYLLWLFVCLNHTTCVNELKPNISVLRYWYYKFIQFGVSPYIPEDTLTCAPCDKPRLSFHLADLTNFDLNRKSLSSKTGVFNLFFKTFQRPTFLPIHVLIYKRKSTRGYVKCKFLKGRGTAFKRLRTLGVKTLCSRNANI